MSLNSMPYQLASLQEISKIKIFAFMWTHFGNNFNGEQFFSTFSSTWDLTEKNYVTWYNQPKSNKGKIIF